MALRIKEVIKQKGITISEFAESLGQGQAVVSSIIRRNSCKMDKLNEYAVALNVPIWELMTDKFAYPAPSDYMAPTWSVQNRLDIIMKELKLNQAKLSQKLGMTPAAVSKCLKQDNLNFSSAEEYAQALGIDPWLLFVSQQEIDEDVARRKGEPYQPAESENNGTVDALPSALTTGQSATPSPTDDLFGWGDKSIDEIMEEVALLAEQEMNEELRKQATRMIPVLSDGEYRYGNMVLILKDGVISTKPV